MTDKSTHIAFFYFSSSGNTKYQSQAIKEGFVEKGYTVDFINIEDVYNQPILLDDYGLVGIASPVFAWQEPIIVSKFVENIIVPQKTIPLFIYITYGGIQGNMLYKLARKLSQKNFHLIWNDGLRAEDNHPVLRRWWTMPFIVENIPVESHYIQAKNKHSFDIIQAYQKDKSAKIRYKIVWCLLDLLAPLYHKTIWFFMPKWVKRKKCTSCGLCANNCPMAVIEMVDKYPKIVNKRACIGCYRCVNICPTDAFRSVFTRRGKRYDKMMPTSWFSHSRKK